jgi:tRNA (cmo5U34)-methyltransferase
LFERANPFVNFDQQAASYDSQWAKLSPVSACMHFLLGTVFSDVPEDARILCVGAGTGAEMIYLAQRFPSWRFTAVEPSGLMLEVCRDRVEKLQIADRCVLHHGYLDSLAPGEPFDAATSILVSQFIVDQEDRSIFFRSIAQRLRPGGYLACADLSFDITTPAYQSLLEVWIRMMTNADVTPEMIERMRAVYGRDVAVLPPEQVAAIIASGGFETPIPFFQAGLIRAWYSKLALRAE